MTDSHVTQSISTSELLARVLPGFRRACNGRTTVAIAAMTIVLTTACDAGRNVELDYLDRVRNEYPALSADVVTDQRLLELAQGTCGPRGVDDEDGRDLAELGIDPDRLSELALPLCPTR